IDAYLGNGVNGRDEVAAVEVSRSGGSRTVRQIVDIVSLRAVDSDPLAGGFPGASAGIHAGNKLSQLRAPVGANDRRRVNRLGVQAHVLLGCLRFNRSE